MSGKSSIQWTDDTWNPVVGCAKVSGGCANCYAERLAARLAAMGRPEYKSVVTSRGKWNGHAVCIPERLEDPLHWKKPRRVFVNSMSDLFHPDIPVEFIEQVFATMHMAHQHTFQVLTKRPESMNDYVNRHYYDGGTVKLPNVWLGVSVEDQKTANERIPWLLKTNAAVRFVSYEPALGPVDFADYIDWDYPILGEQAELGNDNSPIYDTDNGTPPLDWIIAGGESGPRARPANQDWFRSVRDQCQDAGVAFFMKQMAIDGKMVKMPELDGREWSEYPNGQ